jgi:carbon-monoxide dehydrogenase large subunit
LPPLRGAKYVWRGGDSARKLSVPDCACQQATGSKEEDRVTLQGRELAMTGLGLAAPGQIGAGIHLRWALAANLGFPTYGFNLYRRAHIASPPVCVNLAIPAGGNLHRYTSATELTYRSVYPRATLDRALAMVDYPALRKAQAEARQAGRVVGIGLATYVEPNTYGSEFYRTAGIAGSGHDAAIVRIEPSGAITAQIGIVSQGQGHQTTVAQVLADELQVPMEQVRVLAGDTAAAPYGMGTRGSRGGAVSAGAALGAARLLKDKLFRIAAHLLEARPEDLELIAGRVRVRGAPEAGLSVAQLAQKAYLAPLELPRGMEPGLEATHAYDPPALTFSSGTHICVVEIDPDTGRLAISRYAIVEDCGRVLNPKVVAGQLHGATAQGLGGALSEQIIYDAAGQNLSATFLDYALPTASRVPPIDIEHLQRPDPGTPLGVKGMAEGGVMGASAAISNAVADALAPRGVAMSCQPFTSRTIADALRLKRG